MRVVAGLFVLAAAHVVHADPAVEATAGVARWSGYEGAVYGPEATLSGGARIDPRVVVGVRVAGYYMHQPTVRHSDVASVGYTAFAARIGPAVKVDLTGPLWAGASLGVGVARQRDDDELDMGLVSISYAFGFEARLGVTLLRSGFESVAASLVLTTYVADGGFGIVPSAAIGYQFN